MSFAFMPLYTGDYMRDTQHLSLLEHGAYLKLLMHCWDQSGPAPLDERRLSGICNARSKEEITAVYCVLQEFFVKMDDGWYNTRLMRELQKSNAISQNRAEAGRIGGLARAAKQANAKQEPSTCLASAKQVSVTPTPITTTTTIKEKTHSRFSAREYLKSQSVEDQHIEDWLRIRKEKRLPFTKTASVVLENEAEKAGISVAEVVKIAVEEGWAGFKAHWDRNKSLGNSQPAYDFEAIAS